MFLSMPFMMLSIILAMGLRGAGDSRTPLLFMVVTVLLDIVLNPVLIAGVGPFPELGIVGSALATVIATGISLLTMLMYIYAKELPLRLRWHELAYLKPAMAELKYIMSKGVPIGAQMLVISAAGLIVVGLVNREGMLTTAAYGAAMQVFTYIQMPSMAIGAAVSAMAAQYIGARKWASLGELTRAGIIVNAAITGLFTLLVVVFDHPILELFLGQDSLAVPIASHLQLLAAWSFIFFGMAMVLTGTMRAGGAVYLPLLILLVALYPVRLGSYFLTYGLLGADAIWLSFPVGAFAALLLAWLAYRYSPWRERAIAETTEEAAEQVNSDGEPAGRFNPTI
jgi:putative MATE family efflux protein